MLEAQNIDVLFTDWLATGKLTRQPAGVGARRASTNSPCSWTKQYILGNPIWPVRDLPGSQPLSVWLMSELGSLARMNRLTVLMKRPNMKKGSVSHHTSFTTFPPSLAPLLMTYCRAHIFYSFSTLSESSIQVPAGHAKLLKGSSSH